ncbi:MAG: universal stress protein [Bacteroidia bacterium]|nr:universal stress protein [Bacteroidia bacterium]
MIKFNPGKILIPVDFSPVSLNAVNHAVFLAKRYKSEIVLLHVMKDLTDHSGVLASTPEMKKLNGQVGKTTEKKLAELCKKIRKESGVKAEADVSTGSIPREIVRVSEDNSVDLIVMGTHGYSPLEEFILGSNALTVLQLSSCPVMTVRERTEHMYSRVVIPIDLSEHSRQKVNAAVKLAGKYGATVYALGLLGPGEKAEKKKMEVILKQIVSICEKEDVNSHSEVIIAEKNRSFSTLQFTRKIKGDLIVIMSDQETEFSGLLLGPYAHQVINHAHAPVICFKPEVHPERMNWTEVGSYA